MEKTYSLKVGDTVKCSDAEETINLMAALQRENIETDFIYDFNGQKGVGLVVTAVYGKNNCNCKKVI